MSVHFVTWLPKVTERTWEKLEKGRECGICSENSKFPFDVRGQLMGFYFVFAVDFDNEILTWSAGNVLGRVYIGWFSFNQYYGR